MWGDLKFNRKVWFGGVEMSAAEMTVQISPGERKKVTLGERTQWYFTKKIWLFGLPALRVGPIYTVYILTNS